MAEAEMPPCQVCNDEASRFPYSRYTCGECQDFFLRFRQKNLEVTPQCSNRLQCVITSETRHRCQFCHLKKCIEVGMSVDNRLPGTPTWNRPEREMHNDAVQKPKKQNDYTLMQDTVVQAHEDTYLSTREKVSAVIQKTQNKYASRLFCPLNLDPHSIASGKTNNINELVDSYKTYSIGVVEFVKKIPYFELLPKEDQKTILDDAVFQVLFVRLARLFDLQHNSLYCLNGDIIRTDSINIDSKSKELLNCMMTTAEKINNLNLSDIEMGVFCSVVTLNVGYFKLRTDAVLKLYFQLTEILLKLNPNIFQNLLDILFYLTLLDSVHKDRQAHKRSSENIQLPTNPRTLETISNTFASDSVTSRNGPSESPLDLRILGNRVENQSMPKERSNPTERARPKQPEENSQSKTVGQIFDDIVIKCFAKDLPSQQAAPQPASQISPNISPASQASGHPTDLLPEEMKAFLNRQSTIKYKHYTTQPKDDRNPLS